MAIVEVNDSDDNQKDSVPVIAQWCAVPAHLKNVRIGTCGGPATNHLKPSNNVNKARKSTTPSPTLLRKDVTTKAVAKAVKKFSSNSVCVSDLPDFAVKDWHSIFLPTLFDKFFASSEPFTSFFKGSQDFVSLLQLTVEEVYLFSDYKVTPYDALHALVCHD